MVPVLEQLKTEYNGKLVVEFHDVKTDPTMARKYGIRLMPTQIFLNAEGNEVSRHEGYFAFEDIKPVLASMGVTTGG